ncbi:MAG: class I SAM-dependent methyltransferase [Cyanobacteria bacterium P01_E01_bin.42]
MTKFDFEIQISKDEVRNLTIQEEFFWLKQNGKERKVRLHDYSESYRIPYLYEYLMGKVQAQSYSILPSLLINRVKDEGNSIKDLVVLDVGAGSGMMGKALANFGIESIVGIDILPEAAEAAKREYPEVYENYYVEDLSNLSEATEKTLSSKAFNCLICGSALGFNHIPASGWNTAFNAILPNSWIVFNVHREQWEDKGETSFVARHPWIANTEIFEIIEIRNFRYRFYLDGRSLHGSAIIGKKRTNITKIKSF